MTDAADDISLSEIIKACTDAGKATGVGRFTFTIQYSEETDTVVGYITHWFRPTPYAFEDCRAVGRPGSARECIRCLREYVEAFAASREALPEVWTPDLKTPEEVE